jgi:Ankyrin repeats (many copies)
LSYSVSLTSAITSGDERAVNALLANGADVNETTSGGQTALILAIIFNHTHLVQLLIKAGANPELRDNLGLNAIDWAQRRGLTEVLDVLTNNSQSGTPQRSAVKPEPPQTFPTETVPTTAAPAETEDNETVSADEKSRKWVAGLKQRMNEQEIRRLNRNERPLEAPPEDEPAPLTTAAATETPFIETIRSPEPVKSVPVIETQVATTNPLTAKTSPPRGTRKRCPKCNAIYNGDLLFYCAHHIVPLVDADAPIISEPPRGNPPLFWIMVVITLSGSLLVGSLATTYLYKGNQPPAPSAAPQPNIQKGSPEVGGELAGKVVSLPEAECPVRGPQPVTGTVTVRVLVDKDGHVNWARGSGGDWLMRGAATEAAMKSTFSPEKLRRRETEGTITYTFK